MNNYLRIANRGIRDYRYFTVLGASTSRGDSSKIGQFGSGAKHGCLVLIRAGLSPVVMLGKDELHYYTVTEDYGDGHERKRVGVSFKGVKELLSYVLDYGALDWSGPHMALREYISNAIDNAVDGEFKVELVDSVVGVEGWTSVFIPLNAEILDYYNNIHKYFLQLGPVTPGEVILNTTNEAGRVYRRGVLVGSLGQRSHWHYNFKDIKIDESRNVDSFSARYAAAKYFAERMEAYKVIETFKDAECLEITSSISGAGDPGMYAGRAEALKEAWARLMPKTVISVSSFTQANAVVTARGYKVIIVGAACYSAFERVLPTAANCTDDIVQGCVTRQPNVEERTLFDRYWNHYGKGVKPSLLGFDSEHLRGFVKGSTCYLNNPRDRDVLLVIASCVCGSDETSISVRDTLISWLELPV